MRKICYSVAMSLDGYVAGPNGEADWIMVDPEINFQALFSRFDTAIMGRRTFEAAQTIGGGSMPGIRTIVVSTTLRPEEHPGITIIAEDLGGEVARLKAALGKDIWLFGGGALFRSLLELGLVDKVEVAVIPILLGGGIPLLPDSAQRTKLQLVKNRVYRQTGIVSLEYTIEGGR